MNEQDDFLKAFKGSFTSALRWHQLDDLWQVLRVDAAGGWYIYAVGESPPELRADESTVKLNIETPSGSSSIWEFFNEMKKTQRIEKVKSLMCKIAWES